MEDNAFQMNNLKSIREKKHLTQLSLSIDLGLSQELISQYEIGKSKPTIESLLKLADYFHCSTDYLLERTNISTPIDKFGTSNIIKANLIEKFDKLSYSKQQEVIHYLDYLYTLDNEKQ